jgi:hypothetical protein
MTHILAALFIEAEPAAPSQGAPPGSCGDGISIVGYLVASPDEL